MKNSSSLFTRCSALLLTLACFSACDDDDAGDPGTLDGGIVDAGLTPLDGSLSGDAGDGGTPTQPAQPSRYALVTQLVPSADQATSYIAVTDKLESAQKLSLDGAPQVVGRALAAAEAGSGVLFVGSAAAPEIARYELQSDGSLKRVGSVSFQSRGVAGIGEYAAQIQVISSTKAYYFDSRTAQIIVWNPTTLSVTTAIDLRELTIADALLTFTSTLPIRRGTQLVMPVGWRSSNNQKVIKQAAVVVVDTALDTARVLRDERCGYVRDGAEAADGRIYLATEAWGAAVHRVNAGNAPAPCLLRLKSDLSGFDESYYQDLNALTGATTGSLLKTTSGKTFVRVLDEAAANVNAMTAPRALASAAAWSWAEIALSDTPTATKLTGQPLGSGSLVLFETKDRRFLAEVANDGTNIRDVTNGIGEITLSTPGLTFSAVQLR